MNIITLNRSNSNIFFAVFALTSASYLIYLWGTGTHDPFLRYLNIGMWLLFGLMLAYRWAVYPPLTVKNEILYIAPEQGLKRKKVSLAEIDHIEQKRHVFVNLIGRKYFTNSITITNKSGKEIHVNLGAAREKRCREIDDFIRNAFGGIKLIKGL